MSPHFDIRGYFEISIINNLLSIILISAFSDLLTFKVPETKTFQLETAYMMRRLNLVFTEGGRLVRRCWINCQRWGVLLILIIVGQGPIALALGVGWGCLNNFFLSRLSFLFSYSLSGRRPD